MAIMRGKLSPSVAEASFVWAWTVFYFLYVVLGGVSYRVHTHVYTGDPKESALARLRKGQLATFGKAVYERFFFPAFLKYHTTYRLHVFGAGLWLLTAWMSNPDSCSCRCSFVFCLLMGFLWIMPFFGLPVGRRGVRLTSAILPSSSSFS